MIDKRMDLSGAATCWRNSFEYDIIMKLTGESDDIQLGEVPYQVYGYNAEVDSEEKLEMISSDPEAMRMQVSIAMYSPKLVLRTLDIQW